MGAERPLVLSIVSWELKVRAPLFLPFPRQYLHSFTSEHAAKPTRGFPQSCAAGHRPTVSHAHTTAGLSRLQYSLFPTLAPCLWRDPDMSFSDKEVEARDCPGIWLKLDSCLPALRTAALEAELLVRIGQRVRAPGHTQSPRLSRSFS